MSKFKKTLLAMTVVIGTCVAPVAALSTYGQEMTDENGNVVSQDTKSSGKKKGGGFYEIVFGSGAVGMLLWFALSATARLRSTSRSTASSSSSPRS